jgi:hypothetical protein
MTVGEAIEVICVDLIISSPIRVQCCRGPKLITPTTEAQKMIAILKIKEAQKGLEPSACLNQAN